MIAALATSKGAINHHIALGTEAKSVTNPVGTVIVSVLLVSLLIFTPTPFSAFISSIVSSDVVYDKSGGNIYLILEYCSGGDLFSKHEISKFGPHDEEFI